MQSRQITLQQAKTYTQGRLKGQSGVGSSPTFIGGEEIYIDEGKFTDEEEDEDDLTK